VNPYDLIAEGRRRAFKYSLDGWGLTIAGTVLLLTGGIKGLNQIPFAPLQRLTFPPANWVYQHFTLLWALAPYPKPGDPFSFIGWLVWSYGLLMLGLAFRNAASRTKERIDRTEDVLRYQQTNIVQADTIGTVNISQMLQDKKGWWTKPVGIIALVSWCRFLARLLASSLASTEGTFSVHPKLRFRGMLLPPDRDFRQNRGFRGPWNAFPQRFLPFTAIFSSRRDREIGVF
jgi:hypothetical protein